MAASESARTDRNLVYQMHMNGAHNGDQMIQSSFEWWMNRALADLDHWAAIHATDPNTLRAVLDRARDIEQRSGASNAAQGIWEFFLGLMADDR